MKTSLRYGVLFGALALMPLLNSCTKEESITEDYANFDVAAMRQRVNQYPVASLSAEEINSLNFMREEEKLARDVYNGLARHWKVNIFTNIAASEQTHMDAILQLLNKYGLPDPIVSDGEGVFANEALRTLYLQLMERGSVSLLAAYQTGAYIEDLDINDLNNASEFIDNEDILYVYGNLNKGSRNHLRSFYRNVLRLNGTYTPSFLSQETFDAIISGQMETGPWW
ncbi:MAG TPA: DUF2202 domain-containing protein [Saprospiraceae bacterium]|nr:DUF2202 domain-containing protein [Saprospiraceae bacterium]HNT20662.1 DUF2202 domain-containing protein [Saprospiraceae bacterium]